MFKKIKALIDLPGIFQKGKVVANPEAWKKGQITAGVVAFEPRITALVFPRRRHERQQIDAARGDQFKLALVYADDQGFGEH